MHLYLKIKTQKQNRRIFLDYIDSDGQRGQYLLKSVFHWGKEEADEKRWFVGAVSSLGFRMCFKTNPKSAEGKTPEPFGAPLTMLPSCLINYLPWEPHLTARCIFISGISQLIDTIVFFCRHSCPLPFVKGSGFWMTSITH